MRLLFVTSAVASHHFTLIPFAWAALADGHEVRLATSPNMAPVFASSGLPVSPVGPDVDFEGLHQQLLDRVRGGAVSYDPKLVFTQIAELMADDLVDLAERWQPEVVVWDPACLAGPLAAQAVGALSVRYLWGADILGRGSTLVERLPAEFHRLFHRFGMEVPEDPDWWTVDPCPPSVAPKTGRNRLHVRFIPHSPNGELPDWVLAPPPRPRVCLTFGTGLGAREFIAEEFADSPLLQGLRELDAEVVLAVSANDHRRLGRLPDFVRVVSNCPLSALLPTCRATVHHGGYGTLLTSALAGVPQLTIPVRPELRFGSAHFAKTGAVRVLEVAEMSGQIANAHVTDLLGDSEYRTAAARLRAEMLAQSTPDVLVRKVGELITASVSPA